MGNSTSGKSKLSLSTIRLHIYGKPKFGQIDFDATDYHSSVEILGKEYSYQPQIGIVITDHVTKAWILHKHNKSIKIGNLNSLLTYDDLKNIFLKYKTLDKYKGTNYNILFNNCHKFVESIINEICDINTMNYNNNTEYKLPSKLRKYIYTTNPNNPFEQIHKSGIKCTFEPYKSRKRQEKEEKQRQKEYNKKYNIKSGKNGYIYSCISPRARDTAKMSLLGNQFEE